MTPNGRLSERLDPILRELLTERLAVRQPTTQGGTGVDASVAVAGTTDGAAKDGTGGAAKDGTGGAAKDGAATDGTDGAAKDGTDGAAKDGTDGAAKDGTGGAATDGTGGAATDGTGGAAKDGAAKDGAATDGTGGTGRGGADGSTWVLTELAQRRLSELEKLAPDPAKVALYFGHRCAVCQEFVATRLVEGRYVCSACRGKGSVAAPGINSSS